MLVFVKFCTAGFIGVLINFSSTYFLKEVLRLNKYFSNSSGLFIALIINYFLNRIWSFEAIEKPIFIQFSKFILVITFSILFNHVIVYLCAQRLKLNFYLSKIIAIFIVLFWNFFMHLNFTFQ